MTRPTNSGTSASSQLSQSSSQAQSTQASAPKMGASVTTTMGATMAMLVLMEMGVIAPTTSLTTAAAVTQPDMKTFVPPFTAGVHVSTSVPASPYP